jgi:hypothetical protein
MGLSKNKKRKIQVNYTSSKLKTFLYQKHTIKRVKKQTKEWERIICKAYTR